MQNIIFIPAIFLLCNSGVKLYKKVKNDKYSNLKIEFIRHTIIAAFTSILALISSFIEVYGSTNILIFFKKFY